MMSCFDLKKSVSTKITDIGLPDEESYLLSFIIIYYRPAIMTCTMLSGATVAKQSSTIGTYKRTERDSQGGKKVSTESRCQAINCS